MAGTEAAISGPRERPTAHSRWIALGLVVLTLAVFAPATRHAFVDFDDNVYVLENEHVRGGLTWPLLRDEFLRTHWGNYHPLTMLSHALDVELGGLDPFVHHLSSVVLHVVNVLLLFLLLRRMTARTWPSAFVAALFAIHPLNVQSVAWISERKNVLSTLFWLLALHGYLRYIRRPDLGRYLAVSCAFLLGLAAKPMVVTLPLTLLLVDLAAARGWVRPRSAVPRTLRRIVLEKIPLFGASLAAGLLTVWTQHGVGALRDPTSFSLGVRLGTGAIGVFWYVQKMFVPVGLAVTYPHPLDNLDLQRIGLGLLLLAGGSWMAWRLARSRPYVEFGWLWYVATLLPVSGLVQVGFQPYADRYAYVPLIGPFVVVAWTLADWVGDRPRRAAIAGGAGLLALAGLSVAAAVQVACWENTLSLFRRAAEVHPGEYIAEGNYGKALVDAGRLEEAIEHLHAAVEASPRIASAQLNLANALALAGERSEAERRYREAIRLAPEDPTPWLALGALLLDAGRPGDALGLLAEGVRLAPAAAPARLLLARALVRSGRAAEALEQLRAALPLAVDPALRATIENGIRRLERPAAEP